jgi:type IV pilus assembly protein PilV
MRRSYMTLNTQHDKSARARGFTLVEVLVALVVMSIGVLGVGRLVLFSARSNDSAYLRSQAVALAYSILDDMRANRQTALNTGYDVAAANTVPNPGSSCNQGSTCTTGSQLAQYDLYQWATRLQVLGPSGNGSVKTTPVTDPTSGITSFTATVTVSWDDTVARQTFDGSTGTVAVVLETIL